MCIVSPLFIFIARETPGKRLAYERPKRDYTGEWGRQIAGRGNISLHDMVNKSYRTETEIQGLDQPRDWVPKTKMRLRYFRWVTNLRGRFTLPLRSEMNVAVDSNRDWATRETKLI